MTKDPSPSNEPQNAQSLPEHDALSVWAPEFGTPAAETQQPVAQVIGAVAAARWDKPERPPLRESGVFPKDEIEQLKGVRLMLRQAVVPPETRVATGDLNPTAARLYLNDRLRAIELRLVDGLVSKRTAMIVGTLVAASPLGRVTGQEAESAARLIGGGALPTGQLEVLRGIQSNIADRLASGTTDEAAELHGIDKKLYGGDNVTKGFLPQIGEPATQGNENLAAFWLAYAAGLDGSGDSTRRFRNLTDFMSTGERGPDYMKME